MLNKIRGVLARSASYTTLILLAFFAFAHFTDFSEPFIGFKTFLFIFLFAFLISLASVILTLKKIHPVLRIAIHYFSLLISFLIIFIISGNIDIKNGNKIFSSVLLFSFIYAVLYAIVYILRRFASDFSKKEEPKNKTNETKKSKYTPLYSDEDK